MIVENRTMAVGLGDRTSSPALTTLVAGARRRRYERSSATPGVAVRRLNPRYGSTMRPFDRIRLASVRTDTRAGRAAASRSTA